MTVNAPEKKKTECQQTLARVTLNSAEVCTLRRLSEVEPLIERIRDALASGEALSAGEISIRIDRGTGWAVFSFTTGEALVSACHACWSASVSDSVWQTADEMFHRLWKLNGAPDLGYQFDEDAPATPWFTIILLPGRANMSEKQERTITMLEPIFAWALSDIERSSLRETDK